jgi:hypothetical protein
MESENAPIKEFIELNRDLLKVERQEEEDQLKDLLSSKTVKELSSYGLCINNLKVKSTKIGMFDKAEISFIKKGYEKVSKQQGKENGDLDRLKVRKENTRISQGEIVGIYRYKHDGEFFDDHPVLSGSVSKISDFKITIICDSRTEVDVFSATFENDCYSVV